MQINKSKISGYLNSKLIIIFILVIIIWRNFNLADWKEEKKVIQWDVISYYAYLPAVFIHHDIKLEFLKNGPESYKGTFWPRKSPNGGNVIITSMGMAYLYLPFFLMGHLYASLSPHFDNQGFSAPYKFFLVMSSIFYLMLGLIFLRKLLLKFFNDNAVSITLLITLFGTNLLCYATNESVMSHAYSFSLISIFLFLTHSWYNKPVYTNSVFLGLLGGLIILIRPTNVIIALLFLFWKITRFKDIPGRIQFYLKNAPFLFIIIIAVFVIWLPQLLYWKHIAGQWFYFSYGSDEKFFFNNPRIFKVLFSYRKGWFVYTPVMLFAIAGLFQLRKNYKQIFLPVLIFLVVNIYIISAWWSWWYGGSFGMRAMIDSYGIMALPLSAITAYFLDKKRLRIGYLVILLLLVFNNIFNTLQYSYGSIHWDSMSKKAYWNSFLKLHKTDYFEYYLEPIDYIAARKGEYATNNSLGDVYKSTFKNNEFKTLIEEDIRNSDGLMKLLHDSAKSNNLNPDSLILNKTLYILKSQNSDSLYRVLKIKKYMNIIRNNPDYMNMIEKKAVKREISADSMIYLDAVWLFENKNSNQ